MRGQLHDGDLPLGARVAISPGVSIELAGLVLAAGMGTRIAVLSALRPKPLLPVGRSTPLARAAASLRRAGAERVVANASHRAFDVVTAGEAMAIEIVVEEGGPLGTAGGLAAARPRLGAGRVAIWNGDIVTDLDVGALVRALDASTHAIAALGVRGRERKGVGNVGVDASGRVVRLRDRSFGDEAFGAWFTGVHVVDRVVVERAPRRGCLVADVYFPLLAEGAELRAIEGATRWHDVGDLESYLEANVDLLDGARAMVGEGATIGPSIELDRVVVGDGARVEGSGVLSEVVVWPGARAVAPLSRAIVVDDATVVRV